MIQGLSHVVIASNDVSRIAEFFAGAFELKPHFSNPEFCEFVLPNKGRIAFFKATGKAAKFFKATTTREHIGVGLTVKDVQATYSVCRAMEKSFGLTFSGEPKDHPWGEKSFLLIDFEGNRWEITQSPSKDGFLVNI